MLVFAEVFDVAIDPLEGRYNSARDADAVRAIHEVERGHWQEIAPIAPQRWAASTLRPGDVFWIAWAGQPCHVGVHVRDGCFLHTLPDSPTRLERMTDPQWRHRLTTVYRHKALA